MIWATVHSRSCFCWLYKASPSLAAKNIISLISVLIIWWCPCVESSPVLLEEDFCYDHCVLFTLSWTGQTMTSKVWFDSYSSVRRIDTQSDAWLYVLFSVSIYYDYTVSVLGQLWNILLVIHDHYYSFSTHCDDLCHYHVSFQSLHIEIIFWVSKDHRS